jgi:hypothetical protein
MGNNFAAQVLAVNKKNLESILFDHRIIIRVLTSNPTIVFPIVGVCCGR